MHNREKRTLKSIITFQFGLDVAVVCLVVACGFMTRDLDGASPGHSN